MKAFLIIVSMLIITGCGLMQYPQQPRGDYYIDMESVPSEGQVPMGPVSPQQTEPVLVGYTEDGKPIHFVPDPNAAPSIGQQVSGVVDYAGRIAIGMLPLPDAAKQPLKTAWSDMLMYGVSTLLAGGAAAVGGSKVIRKVKASGPDQIFGPDPVAEMKKNA